MTLFGTVLSKSMLADEATCMLNCCNVVECVGYSMATSFLGVTTTSSAQTVTSTSIARRYSAFNRDGAGNTCNSPASYNDNLYANPVGQCGFYVQNSGNSPVITSGSLPAADAPVTRVPCVLLSNVSQLNPSNGWTGAIKLSALGA